jgi:2'-5' RNA ligase
MMVRLFVAIGLPTEVRAALVQASADIVRPLPPGVVRPVQPRALHLTLRFLGESSADTVPALSATLDRIATEHPPFHLALDKTGCLPDSRRPRVVYAGLRGDLASLTALQAAIEDGMVAHRFPRESRPFLPHVTIGRIRDYRQLAGRTPAVGQALPAHPWHVTACHLIRSELRPQGPLYTTLHTATLARL